MKAIIHTNVVFPDHVVADGTVLIEGERIVAAGRGIDTAGAEVIDAGGAFTGPGFIDIHTHAAEGRIRFSEDPTAAAAVLLSHGVTDVLPALYFSSPPEELLTQIRTVRGAKNAGKAPNILGLYMEAPYLNPKFGCNRENNPWGGAIRRADYEPLLREAGDFAKVWCVAPEREHIEDFVADAKTFNPAAVFTVAHSEASPEEIARLIPLGLRIGTHHTNATGTRPKYPECRGVCVDEAVWYYDEIYAELICDRVGIHVDPFMLRLVRKIKGDGRIILISDSFVDDGPVPPGYDGVDDINFDHAGEIAGTKLTLDLACRNMMRHTGCSIGAAFQYASTNPARALGLTDRGEIAPGKLANLVLVDPDFRVRNVFLRGYGIR